MNEVKARILAECQKQNYLTRLQNDFSQVPDDVLQQLVRSVDESEYGLEEWLLVLNAFYLWEDQSHRSLPLSHKIEYIHCCVEGAGPGRLQPLATVWHDYVQTYGVE